MEPIINPLWFYLFNVIDNIRIFSALVWFLVTLFCVYYFIVEGASFNIKEYKFFRRAAIVSCAGIIFLALLPSKEALYQMLVASYITPDNIELVGGAGQSIVDYIIESVNELLN